MACTRPFVIWSVRMCAWTSNAVASFLPRWESIMYFSCTDDQLLFITKFHIPVMWTIIYNSFCPRLNSKNLDDQINQLLSIRFPLISFWLNMWKPCRLTKKILQSSGNQLCKKMTINPLCYGNLTSYNSLDWNWIGPIFTALRPIWGNF